VSAVLGVVAIAALVLAILSYVFHKRVAPRPPQSSNKVAPYACGELLPAERVPVRVLFFKYACLFLVLDVVALLLAFTLGTPTPLERPVLQYLSLSYGLVALAAILLLGVRE